MTQTTTIVLAALLVLGAVVAIAPAASALPSPLHCTVDSNPPFLHCGVHACVGNIVCISRQILP